MTKASRKKRFQKAGRGSVFVISALLMSSALLRLTSGVAMAEDSKVTAKPLPEMVQQESELATSASPATQTTKPDRVEVAGLLEALQEREARVKEREKQIALRAKALSVADEEIIARLRALEEAEVALRATLSLADGAAENDLARLTSVYESMKPKDAAALFETMEPDFAAGFLGRMRPDIAAAVMTGLSPDVAYSISVILAGRNAKVPKS